MERRQFVTTLLAAMGAGLLPLRAGADSNPAAKSLKILILGGTGFLGRLLIRGLQAAAPERAVSALDLDGMGTDAVAWNFRGAVEPLSMRALTGALGWPTFAGTVAGEPPITTVHSLPTFGSVTT